MSDRTPENTDPRVVEGQVIEETIEEKMQRGQAYSDAKAKEHAENGADIADEMQTISSLVNEQSAETDSAALELEDAMPPPDAPKKPAFVSKYANHLLWSLLFVIVILTLILTRPNQDWQIQHISDLQNQVAQLNQEQQDFEARLSQQSQTLATQINAEVSKVLAQPEHRPLVSEADLQALKESAQQQMAQLQSAFEKMSAEAQQQLKQALQGDNQSSAASSPEAESTALQAFEQRLASEMAKVGSKLTELLDFKAAQLALQTRTPTPTLSVNQPLSRFQIQQWIVQINTQWLLNGRVDETLSQLLALEQAVGLSDFENKTGLARLIGQDTAQLQQLAKSLADRQQLNTNALKALLKTLGKAAVETPGASPKIAEEAVQISAGEAVTTDSALDSLMARFGQLISLKKRESADDITQIESLLMHDVLVQRLALLIDRLDWMLQRQASPQLRESVQQIKDYVGVHFPDSSAQFDALLQPFSEIEFNARTPLAMMSLPVAAAE